MHLKGHLICCTGEGDGHSCQGITPWLLRPHFSWNIALTGAPTPIQTESKAPARSRTLCLDKGASPNSRWCLFDVRTEEPSRISGWGCLRTEELSRISTWGCVSETGPPFGGLLWNLALQPIVRNWASGGASNLHSAHRLRLFPCCYEPDPRWKSSWPECHNPHQCTIQKLSFLFLTQYLNAILYISTYLELSHLMHIRIFGRCP
jgi:hypothetical protein